MTTAEEAHKAAIRQFGCLLCGSNQVELHHIKRDPRTGQSLGMSMKGDYLTLIPLCFDHHWNGKRQTHPFKPIGSKEFERLYGNELDLLALTFERLGIPYPWDQAS